MKKLGFELVKIQNNAEAFKIEKTIQSNPYLLKDIIKKEDIKKYINFLFIKNNLKKLLLKKQDIFFY